jgi:hypothetical protein
MFFRGKWKKLCPKGKLWYNRKYKGVVLLQAQYVQKESRKWDPKRRAIT